MAPLQQDLDNLSSWSAASGPAFNDKKCKLQTITRKRKPICASYEVNGSTIKSCEVERDLSVSLDCDLTLHAQVSHQAESEFVFRVSLHSAKRRYDILNLTVSLIMDKRKDVFTNFPLLYLSLCRLVVRLYLGWKADLFFITLGHSLRSQRSACKLMVSEKN